VIGSAASAGTDSLLLSRFEHEAFLYEGAAGFLQGTMPFIQDGLNADEPVLVVVDADKIGALRSVLGTDARRVSFRDMAEVGRNPARIIPAWREFVDQRAGEGSVRGIGEPVWAARSPEELNECRRHEALLNVAFAGGTPWRLLCPYDTSTLGPDVIAEAGHSHPFLSDGRARQESAGYLGDGWTGGGGDLPEAPGDAVSVDFEAGPLDALRGFVADHARAALGPDELADLLLAVSEVAANSVVHGGGCGSLRLWGSGNGVVCEIRDRGWIREPLVGRVLPALEGDRGRGLWMVNQLCDLMELRSAPTGTVIRLHAHRRGVSGRHPA
jgi:anti-sigma regulatory factor (Ser/Thr protein kinase)